MDKRLLLALVLSLLFVFIYGQLTGVMPRSGSPATEPTAAAPGAATPEGAPGGDVVPSTREPVPPSKPVVPSEPSVPSRRIAFSGDGFVSEFQTAGATLAWLQLTHYHTEADNAVPMPLFGDQGDNLGNF